MSPNSQMPHLIIKMEEKTPPPSPIPSASHPPPPQKDTDVSHPGEINIASADSINADVDVILFQTKVQTVIWFN